MPANPIFGGGAAGDIVGITGVLPYGQREKFLFAGNWLVGDLWQTTLVTTIQGDITIGVGNLDEVVGTALTALTPTVAFTFKNRVYLGLGIQFSFSDNGDPTSWEQQAPGAGSVQYLSYFGSQDTISAIQQLQGRLIVVGSRSTQIWTVDADPANFSLVQEMDYIGTQAPLSAQNLGDYDVIMLDPTGFRSLRQREVTLNAYVDDVGIPIDELVQDDLGSVSPTTCCSIVDPTTKRYWGYLNGHIYVFSRFPSSKISAWSTYDCTDQFGKAFTPQKFIVFNGIIYCRTTDGRLIAYGGATGSTFDGTIMTVELPWLNDKQPEMIKYSKALNIACTGTWNIRISMDPKQFAATGGAATSPAFSVQGAKGDESYDSTFDLLRVAFEQRGTHWKFIATSDPTWTDIAVISEIQFLYNEKGK